MTFVSVRDLFLKVKKNETVQMLFEDYGAKLNFKLIKAD